MAAITTTALLGGRRPYSLTTRLGVVTCVARPGVSKNRRLIELGVVAATVAFLPALVFGLWLCGWYDGVRLSVRKEIRAEISRFGGSIRLSATNRPASQLDGERITEAAQPATLEQAAPVDAGRAPVKTSLAETGRHGDAEAHGLISPKTGPEYGMVPSVRIAVHDNRLSLEATSQSYTLLLRELTRRTGIVFRLSPMLEGNVTVSFKDAPVEHALRRLFGPDAGIVAYYAQASSALPKEVWVVGATHAEAMPLATGHQVHGGVPGALPAFNGIHAGVWGPAAALRGPAQDAAMRSSSSF